MPSRKQSRDTFVSAVQKSRLYRRLNSAFTAKPSKVAILGGVGVLTSEKPSSTQDRADQKLSHHEIAQSPLREVIVNFFLTLIIANAIFYHPTIAITIRDFVAGFIIDGMSDPMTINDAIYKCLTDPTLLLAVISTLQLAFRLVFANGEDTKPSESLSKVRSSLMTPKVDTTAGSLPISSIPLNVPTEAPINTQQSAQSSQTHTNPTHTGYERQPGQVDGHNNRNCLATQAELLGLSIGAVPSYFELCVNWSKTRISLGEIQLSNASGKPCVTNDMELFGKFDL